MTTNKPNLTHSLCFMLSGHAGVGKTYCANQLAGLLSEAGLNSYQSHFANGVKFTARLMGWDGNKDKKGRLLLQNIGKIGREYNPYMWAKGEFDSLSSLPNYPFDAITIDDWRFENELSYVTKNEPLYKTITIKIVATDRECLKGTPEYDDISETELNDFKTDYIIYNGIMVANYPYMVNRLVEILSKAISDYSIPK
jgi:hypothetical protein